MFYQRWSYLFFLLLLTFLSACASPKVSDYKAQTLNAGQLSTLDGGVAQKIAVDQFTATTSRVDMGCRAFGEINLKEGISVEGYIRNAIISELKGASLYSDSSAKRLGGNIDYVNLNTTSLATYTIPGLESLTDSKWSITATFKGNDESNFTIPSM